jgi:hypothetical protein
MNITMPRKYVKKTTRPRRKIARRRHVHRGTSHAQYAKAVYKTEILNVPNESPVKFVVPGISSNARITALGALYQDYRITAVKIKFAPNLNTFGAGTTTGYLPQMLTKVFDIQPPPVWGETYITSMDPKTHEITQKDFTVSFPPKVNMLASTTGATGQGVMIKKSPWLSTNANANTGGAWAADSTEHFGLLAYITNSAGNDTIGCGFQGEIFVEFRRPLAQYVAPTLDKNGNVAVERSTVLKSL